MRRVDVYRGCPTITKGLGALDDGTARIEEIKTTFNTWELQRALKENPYDHPYSLQLLTYGYVQWKKAGTVPELLFVERRPL
jgi:hypothetical protein